MLDAKLISKLKDLDWSLGLFYNAGRTSFRENNKIIPIHDIKPTGSVFQETGVRVGKILSFLCFDFAWRLNHFKDGRNFYTRLLARFPFTVVMK